MTITFPDRAPVPPDLHPSEHAPYLRLFYHKRRASRAFLAVIGVSTCEPRLGEMHGLTAYSPQDAATTIEGLPAFYAARSLAILRRATAVAPAKSALRTWLQIALGSLMMSDRPDLVAPAAEILATQAEAVA